MSNPRLRLAVIFVAIVCGAAGCAWLNPATTISTDSDFDKLATSSGMNGGSYFYATWYYRGSDAERDYFYHYHHRDNIWYRDRVEVMKGVVALSFPERFAVGEGKSVPVQEIRDSGRVAGFGGSYGNVMIAIPES